MTERMMTYRVRKLDLRGDQQDWRWYNGKVLTPYQNRALRYGNFEKALEIARGYTGPDVRVVIVDDYDRETVVTADSVAEPAAGPDETEFTIYSYDENGDPVREQPRQITVQRSDVALRLIFHPQSKDEREFEPDLWVAVEGRKIVLAFHQDDGWDPALYLEYEDGALQVRTNLLRGADPDFTIDPEGNITHNGP
jgi:hypothetical protein